MKNLKKLTETEMKSLNGGRIKKKFDVNGDGIPDVKFVWTNDGKLIKIKAI